jgi:hypothetical protein
MNEKLNDETHQKIHKASQILIEVMQFHPNIEFNQWLAAFMSLVAKSYSNQYLHDQFKEDMSDMVQYYKFLWDEE